MSNYNPQKHNRRSIRLKGYDYSQAGLYFITLCCQNRAHLFGQVINGQMKLNSAGEIASKEWQNTENIRKNTAIHEFIIMPNHMHGIIEITKKISDNKTGKFQSPSHSIGAIIRGYKIATIKKIKDLINNNIENSNLREKRYLNPEKKKYPNLGEKKYPGELENPSTGELQFARKIAPMIIQLNYKIWQRNYWEHIIRNENEYYRISRYIINNPKKWTQDILNGGKGNQVMEPPSGYNK